MRNTRAFFSFSVSEESCVLSAQWTFLFFILKEGSLLTLKGIIQQDKGAKNEI